VTAGELRIALAGAGDADALARLHEKLLPDSRLSLFGHGYLASCYRYFLRSTDELVFAARDGERVIGGGFVSLVPNSLSRRLLTHTSLLAQLALRPLGRGGRQIATDLLSPSDPTRVTDEPELVAIFVAPESRSRGIGEAICRAVERELSRRHVSSYRVRTERSAANRAIAFYHRLGFVESGASIQGRFMTLSKPLP